MSITKLTAGLCLGATLALTACAGQNRGDTATVYTETGIRLAEEQWDRVYRDRADHCKTKHEPMTPGMEGCFGRYYDADGKVEDAVRGIVALLRTYWTARAAGERPNWWRVAEQVSQIVDDLPPEAAEIFKRVEGLR